MENGGNTDTRGFGGRPVVTFESRRSTEMASLIERHGGAPLSAPALRELKIEDNPSARAFARALLDEVASELDRVAFAAALGRITTIVRGPKPALVLRELGVPGFITVPAPSTWREIVATLQARGPLTGLRIAVQEHGAPSVELYEALAHAGAHVTAVAVYKWALPEDTAPLRAALHALAEGRARIALFTSRSQVEHAFAVAAEEQIAVAVKATLRRGVSASIGPVCTEALLAAGLTPDLEPTHSKMGHLVKECAEKAPSILEAKDSSPV